MWEAKEEATHSAPQRCSIPLLLWYFGLTESETLLCWSVDLNISLDIWCLCFIIKIKLYQDKEHKFTVFQISALYLH